MFDDEDEEEKIDQPVIPKKMTFAVDDDEDDDMDDLDDFIIDDEENEDNKEENRLARLERKKQKKKMVRNMGLSFGISDDTWREIEDIFGDGTDYDWALVPGGPIDEEVPEVKVKTVSLNDLYEPDEIQSKMLTENDEIIRTTDIPERYQIVGAPAFIESQAESQSIYISEIIMNDMNMANRPSISTLQIAVLKTIRFIVKDNYEIPFIHQNRKDHVGILSLENLYRVFDLLQQFHTITARKDTVEKLIDELATGVKDFIMDVDQVVYLRASLNQANTIEEVNDVYNHLQTKYSNYVSKIETEKTTRTFKRPARRKLHEEARDAGLEELSSMFGIDVKSFVPALISGLLDSYTPVTCDSTPEMAALQFVCTSFPSIELALEGARNIIALEISNDPSLKSFTRRIYESDGVVNVVPTEKGKVEIDANHPYYHFKYLKSKPVASFDKGQFLMLLDAEQQGLIFISAHIENKELFSDDMRHCITADLESDLVALWNIERKKVVETAMDMFLFPALVKGLKERLYNVAMDHVIKRCTDGLLDVCSANLGYRYGGI